MFTVTKMTLKLKDGRIVEIDLNNPSSPIAATSAPLTPKEESDLAFRVGYFLGAGYSASEELN